MKKKAGWLAGILAALVAAGVISKDWYCQKYPEAPICAPTPTPTVEPTPTPTVEPTPTPTIEPTPTPTPIPTPTPTPTPTPSTFPVRFPVVTAVFSINDKPYGQGFDATLLMEGDPDLCYQLHHEKVSKCHFDSGVWGPGQRAQYEMEVMGGARDGRPGRGPLCYGWQYLASQDGKVYQCHDDQGAYSSCDHFGSVEYRDDPQTPTSGTTLETLVGFEGEPKQCGLQRDAFGPNAGFFTVAHGIGQIRACLPLDPTNCGPWRAYNH